MCIIKNKSRQKISGDNYGKVAGRDIIENYYDQSKEITIIQKIYNTPTDEEKKYYSEEYKNYVNSFKELEDYIFSFVFPKSSKKYEFSSYYLDFMKELLDWIMGVSEFPSKKYKNFCSELINIYKIDENDIILKRWEAFESYFSSNIAKSVDIYYNLLKDIDSIKYPYDLLDDILIDGRNISIELEQLNNKIVFDSPFQKEIDKHGRKLAMSIYDRIKADIYEKVLKDTFNVETKDQNTIMFGSGLASVLNEIQNLIYNTIFYGSITHIKLCRKVISNVMYSYSKIYENEKFYRITLKMLALSGEYKEYEKLCLYLGDTLNFWYSPSFIEEIYGLMNRSLDYKKINYQNFIYGFYGKYLSDKSYLELEKYIYQYLEEIDNININLVLEMFKNIKNNIFRNNNLDELMNIFEIFVSKNYVRYYYEISNILNNIDVDNMEINTYKRYVEIVYKLLNTKNNININLNASIVNILNKNQCVRRFYKYKKDINIKELMSLNEEISDNYNFLNKMIDDYKRRFDEKEGEPNVVVSYDISYILSREYFIEASKNNEIVALIRDKYFPLILNILKSEKQTNSFKLEQLKNLLYIVSIEDYVFIKEEIIDIISKIEYGYGKENKFVNCFNYNETSNYEIDLYVKLINILLNNSADINEFITLCFEENFNTKVYLQSIISCLKVIGDSKKENEVLLNQIYCFYISVSKTNYLLKFQTVDLLSWICVKFLDTVFCPFLSCRI